MGSMREVIKRTEKVESLIVAYFAATETIEISKENRSDDKDPSESLMFVKPIGAFIEGLEIPCDVLEEIVNELRQSDDYPMTREESVPVGTQASLLGEGGENEAGDGEGEGEGEAPDEEADGQGVEEGRETKIPGTEDPWVDEAKAESV